MEKRFSNPTHLDQDKVQRKVQRKDQGQRSDISLIPEKERRALRDLGFNFNEVQPERKVGVKNNHIFSVKIHTQKFPDSAPLTKLPESISWLEHLEILNIDKNYIKELPVSLQKLSKLVRLDLSHNQISTIPDWIQKLPKLAELDLSHNQITHMPDWLGQMPNLDTLHLAHNLISAVSESLGKIYYLDLEDNSISLFPENYNQPSATYLYLGGNPLRSLASIPEGTICRQPSSYLSPRGQELYLTATLGGEYEPVLEYYAKHPMALARQFAEAEVLLTSEEEERLIFEAGPTEIAYLQSIFPPHYPLMQKIAHRRYPPVEDCTSPPFPTNRSDGKRRWKVATKPEKITMEMFEEEFREYERGTPFLRYVRKLDKQRRQDRNEPVHKMETDTDK
ncbi:leucine-rich repeat domain-containing protein [Candidatus Lokiarchaeum ossiferum]|uniref:leucine-rich repeat domain-containing protein n=1 Tax=Candidatus Lokiarchaeum ossiferum TaxID=2951803 RepID=UPI00352E78C4